MKKGPKVRVRSATDVLEDRIQTMKSYLQMKLNLEDWHGVADAAMDIREMCAELKGLRSIQEKIAPIMKRWNDEGDLI